AIDEFPIATWESLRAKVLADKGSHLLRYGSNRGEPELREALAAYLCDFRGARCRPHQIIITAGTQQAMMLTALALVEPGQPIWIEDPGYHQARRVFSFMGATVVPRKIDRHGMVVAKAARKNPPRLIFVTPSHQYPLGRTMSLARRHELLSFAETKNAYVLEDDYDSEFRFNEPPLPCLQGLDESGRVIYAGTMSKILFPSLRLGYLVVPEPLLDAVLKIRTVMDQHSPSIDQVTLARFITEGFFLSYVKRMRKLYAGRRDFFAKEFNRLLGDRFTLDVPEGGLHMVGWLRDPADFDRVIRLREETWARPSPLSFFCIEAKLPPAFVFGFAAWSTAQIRESLEQLAVGLKRRK
ncbi:MAG: PLP-dependent aminotransferase family protein, partial [Verrucomicrobiota bacterium]|nr:PLP-dependent aminotransferase family protein [Verrucomicrobiota bacterium]